ncbi:MAG: hypothetical protein OEY50_04300, partial [Nitrospinota bacterium]|nr:hypothetical protein [Nitrospinota bacterium]
APEYSLMAVGRVAQTGVVGDSTATKAVGTALNHLGKPYDFIRLGEIWLMEKMEVDGIKDTAGEKDSFICSEFVALAYRAAGLDLVPDKPDHLTTPADILGSALVERKFDFSPR